MGAMLTVRGRGSFTMHGIHPVLYNRTLCDRPADRFTVKISETDRGAYTLCVDCRRVLTLSDNAEIREPQW